MKIFLSLLCFCLSTAAFSQSALTDATSGCRYTLPWTCDACTMQWTGDCQEGLPNGKGILTVYFRTEEIMKYQGQMSNGEFNGFGKYKDGMTELEGFFLNGNFFTSDSSRWFQYQDQKIDAVYLNELDRSKNRYLAVRPKETPFKGYMFLIPSFYETPEHVLEQTDLPILAARQGIMTIIPTFKSGLSSFGIDDLTQLSFREMLEDVHKRYDLSNLNFYVGGFSIGGSCAVKFAEEAVKDNYPYQPDAIFVVDPPLDFIRFYNSMKRTLRIAPNSKLAKEDLYFLGRMEEEMKGSPSTAYDTYIDKSPYCFSDTNQTAIKHIINTPIRYYTEPELHWKMKEFGSADYSDLNAIDGSCMINELILLGNKNAELMLTEDKGYRKPNNRKQPHSWSIVDDEELIQWLKSVK